MALAMALPFGIAGGDEVQAAEYRGRLAHVAAGGSRQITAVRRGWRAMPALSPYRPSRAHADPGQRSGAEKQKLTAQADKGGDVVIIGMVAERTSFRIMKAALQGKGTAPPIGPALGFNLDAEQVVTRDIGDQIIGQARHRHLRRDAPFLQPRQYQVGPGLTGQNRRRGGAPGDGCHAAGGMRLAGFGWPAPILGNLPPARAGPGALASNSRGWRGDEGAAIICGTRCMELHLSCDGPGWLGCSRIPASRSGTNILSQYGYRCEKFRETISPI